MVLVVSAMGCGLQFNQIKSPERSVIVLRKIRDCNIVIEAFDPPIDEEKSRIARRRNPYRENITQWRLNRFCGRISISALIQYGDKLFLAGRKLRINSSAHAMSVCGFLFQSFLNIQFAVGRVRVQHGASFSSTPAFHPTRKSMEWNKWVHIFLRGSSRIVSYGRFFGKS